jgi:hypothetical protein
LQIVLGAGGLMAGSYAAINPLRGIEELPRVRDLRGGQ